MELKERIKALRKEQKLSQKELAAKIGVHPQTIFHWENGRQEPNPTQRKKLCKIFNITESELFGVPHTIKIENAEIPIVSSVGATDDLGQSAFIPLEPPYKTISFKNCKALTCESNSMAPICYQGQKIIYSETEPVRNGDLVFIKLKNGDQLFKRYFKSKKNKMITLQSINPTVSYEPITLEEDEIEFCYKVVGVKF